MTQLALITPSEKSYVTVIDGRPMTSSLDIANRFGKRHTNVLRAIAKLECSEAFSQLNFEPANFIDEQGKRRPAYRITRDGFAFLAMGFTGKEAARWKEAYINAFNRMEAELLIKAKPTPKALPNGLTKEQQDSIKALVRARVEACPKNKQAKAAITCWSAIKSKYGCTYKAVPTTEYPEVLSLLARLPLEGELLDPEPAPAEPPALEPLSFARALKALNAPNGVYVDTDTLMAFIQAANARLAARCKYYETKCGY